jgi:hypothetical protein
MVKPDGSKYYGYVLCYVDDCLAIEMDPQKTIDMLRRTYKLKEGSVKEPDLYLGSNVKKLHVSDFDEPGRPCWSMSSKMYVKRAIKEVEAKLTEVGWMLPTRTTYILRLQTGDRSDAGALW